MRRLLLLSLLLAACTPAPRDRPDCVPACDGRSCGDDGCKGTCGECEGALVCAEGACVDRAVICGNGRLDPGETDVDCGGACSGCAEGKACSAGGDCVSGQCAKGRCTACADGRKGGDETDIDCGGRCTPCAAGRSCAAPADCASENCSGGRCGAPASCSDDRKSPGETDVDCGGPACAPCAVTKFCAQNSDCLSLTCLYGVCERPTCSDRVRNQDESDVDCGGVCGKCGDGKACARADDCTGGRCIAGVCASCTNGAKDGDETDADCGGTCATRCGDGKVCRVAGDCASGRCTDGRCTSCSDGARNGDETDVDCGGSCASDCADGKVCRVAGDCRSANCLDGKCISCSDRLKNGTETDIDCGGACADCGDGRTCASGADCTGKGCEGGRCCTLNRCGRCGALPAETCNGIDDDCDGQTDEASEVGTPPTCALQKGVCAGARSRCGGAAGWLCDDALYRAHSSFFESAETTCDTRDNDCDGTTDEGLLNACGRCGAPPAELCNSRDDDCDGGTDEIAECAACPATPAETVVETGAHASGSVWPWDAMTLDGTTVYVAQAGRYDVPARVVRVAAGQAPVPVGPEIPHEAGLAFANGELFLATADRSYSAYDVRLHRFAPAATSTTATSILPDWMRNRLQYYDARLAMRGASGAAVFWAYDNYYNQWSTYATRLANGQWSSPETLAANDRRGTWLAVTPAGDAWAAYWDKTRRIDVAASEETLTGESAARLRVDSAGTPVLLVEKAASQAIGLRRRTASGWGAFENITSTASAAADIAWTADGQAYAAWVPRTASNLSVVVARRSASGGWPVVATWPLLSGTDVFGGLQMAVDSLNRVHLIVSTWVFDPAQYVNVSTLRYAIVCPAP